MADFLAGQARCLEAARRYDELLGVIFRQISAEKSDAKLALLHTRMASLQETVLKNEVRAMEHYRTAVRLAPGFEPPIQGLLAIAERRGDWPTVVEVLKIRLRTEARPKERATVLTRLGEVVAQQMRDPRKALTYLERAIREYPRGLQARLLILELLCEQREFARAERFATPPDVSEAQGLNAAQLARLCQIRARVAAERGRPLEALECLTLALEVAPKPRPILEDLVALLRREEPESNPPEVLARKARDWDRTGERELAALALLCQGLLLQCQGRIEQAETALVRARELAPGVPSFAESVADLYYRSRRMQEAADAFVAAALPGHPSEARLTVRASTILSEHLEQHERGLELLRELHARGTPPPTVACTPPRWRWRWAGPTRRRRRWIWPPGGCPPSASTCSRACGWTCGGRAAPPPARWKPPCSRRPAPATSARCGRWRTSAWSASRSRCWSRCSRPSRATGSPPPSGSWRTPGAARATPPARWSSTARRSTPPAGRAWRPSRACPCSPRRRRCTGWSTSSLAEPFNPRGLSLLSNLLAATGEMDRAKSLHELVSLFQDGPREPQAPQLERFWSRLDVQDPFLSFLILLRQKLPRAFEPREMAIASKGKPVTLPDEVKQSLLQLCGAGRLSMPTVLTHPTWARIPSPWRRPSRSSSLPG